jgi:hypothetical protein
MLLLWGSDATKRNIYKKSNVAYYFINMRYLQVPCTPRNNCHSKMTQHSHHNLVKQQSETEIGISEQDKIQNMVPFSLHPFWIICKTLTVWEDKPHLSHITILLQYFISLLLNFNLQLLLLSKRAMIAQSV